MSDELVWLPNTMPGAVVLPTSDALLVGSISLQGDKGAKGDPGDIGPEGPRGLPGPGAFPRGTVSTTISKLYVSPATGDDSATGATIGTPIKTLREVQRRIGATGIDGTLRISILDDVPDTDRLFLDYLQASAPDGWNGLILTGADGAIRTPCTALETVPMGMAQLIPAVGATQWVSWLQTLAKIKPAGPMPSLGTHIEFSDGHVARVCATDGVYAYLTPPVTCDIEAYFTTYVGFPDAIYQGPLPILYNEVKTPTVPWGALNIATTANTNASFAIVAMLTIPLGDVFQISASGFGGGIYLDRLLCNAAYPGIQAVLPGMFAAACSFRGEWGGAQLIHPGEGYRYCDMYKTDTAMNGVGDAEGCVFSTWNGGSSNNHALDCKPGFRGKFLNCMFMHAPSGSGIVLRQGAEISCLGSLCGSGLGSYGVELCAGSTLYVDGIPLITGTKGGVGFHDSADFDGHAWADELRDHLQPIRPSPPGVGIGYQVTPVRHRLAPKGAVVGLASGALGGHRVVVQDVSGAWGYADPAIAAHAALPIGITHSAAIANDTLAIYTEAGAVVTEPSWSWTVGDRIFFGASGVLTQAPPTTGFIRAIATAMSPTSIRIINQPPIFI